MMKLFEITKDTQYRRIVKVFGLKIARFKPTKRFLLRKLQNEINLLKASLDINALPHANGYLRDIQLANFAIMKEVVRFCNVHGLTYWMSDGTLLGAVRHRGFIPWDDDIDLGMMRDDYERFVELFNRFEHEHPDLYAMKANNKLNSLIKVKHKKLPFLFVDIFVFDYYYGRLDGWETRCEFTRYIKDKQRDANVPDDEESAFYKNWRDAELCGAKGNSFEGKPLVYRGLDFFSESDHSLFYDYDDMFPLQKLPFEGEEFAAPRRPFVHLMCTYGNYMDFPSDRYSGGHVNVKAISFSDMMDIKDWLDKNGLVR